MKPENVEIYVKAAEAVEMKLLAIKEIEGEEEGDDYYREKSWVLNDLSWKLWSIIERADLDNSWEDLDDIPF